MPDIKTEMHKIIEDWNTPKTTVTQSPPTKDKRITNNVSRNTFECVRDNPGITRRNLVTRLKASGYKESSTTSLVTQFLRGGLLRDEHGKLYAVSPEYQPMYAKIKAASKAKDKPVSEPVAEPVTEARAKSKFIIRKSDFDPKKIVGPLTVYQARDLYNELRGMFGA